MLAPFASSVGRSLLTYPPFLSFAASTAGLAAAPFTYAAGKIMAKRKYSIGKGKQPTGYGVRVAKRRRTMGRTFRTNTMASARRRRGFNPRRSSFRFRSSRRSRVIARDTRHTGTYDSGTCSVKIIQRRYPRFARSSILGEFIKSDAWAVKQTSNTACIHGWTRVCKVADSATLNTLEGTMPLPANHYSSMRRWLLKYSQTMFEVANIATIPIKVTFYVFMDKVDNDQYYNVGGTATLNPVRDPYEWLVECSKKATDGATTADTEQLFGWDLSFASPAFKTKYKTVKIMNCYIPACQTRSFNLFVRHNKIVNYVLNPDQVGNRYTTVHVLARARTTQGADATGASITFESARMNFMGYTKYHYTALSNRSQVTTITGLGQAALAVFPDPQNESVTTAPVAMVQS